MAYNLDKHLQYTQYGLRREERSRCAIFNQTSNEIWRDNGHHIYIYTPPPGVGLGKLRKWLVYTISWYKRKLPQSTQRPRCGVCIYVCIYIYIYKMLYFGADCTYRKNWYTPAIFLFFLSPNLVVYIYIYIYMVCLVYRDTQFMIGKGEAQLNWIKQEPGIRQGCSL